ncbi:MAG: hypothetical protein ACKO96_44585, partial [Flammeovirgaceae bacterium]
KRNIFEGFLDPIGQGLLLTVDVVGSTQWKGTFEDPAVQTTGAFLDPRRHFSHTGDAFLQLFTLVINTSELLF